ncbi:oocyte zinc finger protein XlCOF28-like isoform X1 [Octopus sinensis]|uniref:Oocyte zinc finger protein XlCOF28-like isoform X1 n=1 Tax=Octopus sinensis TaxID=2607531 RepID=A0A6P7T1Q3_9MOLL|nr:oocyte zinc finger protein XlCOF28-like isoform X1 [Octopus sinensis]XP_036365261.1 oocyte zinc finger protein XlCOF28-like isoform X1 [Octopus sinensis]
MEGPDTPEDPTKTYLCQACNLNFKDFHEWKLHLTTHPITKYDCNFCFSSYSNKTDFWEHIKTHTNSSTAVKYFCSKYPLEMKEQTAEEESEQTGPEKGVVEADTGTEPLKTNSVSNLDATAEHSVMSVEEEEPVMATDVDQLDGGKTDEDSKADDEDDENFDDESPDDEKTNNDPQSADAAAKQCRCQFCDKSFPSAFLFKVHLKKHCLPLTYLQVKCLGESVSLGILVGKSD